ncbi:MAG: IS110 family transposase [Candidatus Gracilibacteria bacterium]|jgi:transposase
MYCGLDVSKNKSNVCLLDEDKKVINEFEIKHDIEGFKELEKYLTPETKIGMEITGNYSKIIHRYFSANYKVIYIDSRQMNTFARLYSPTLKNDKADAKLIAMALTIDLKSVIPSKMDELKNISLLYQKTVKQLTRYKSMFKDQINIIFPELENLMCNNGNMGLANMLLKYPRPIDIVNATDEELKQALRENLKRAGRFDIAYAKEVKAIAQKSVGISDYPIAYFLHVIKTMLFYKLQTIEIKKGIDNCIKKTPYYKLMNEFGYNLAGLSTILGEVGDINRFATSKKFASYCGFSIYEKKSGTSVNKSSHIAKSGNRKLRYAFYMMALIHLRYKTEYSKFFYKLKEKGKHPKKCMIALARKLAVKCYYDLKGCLVTPGTLPV